MLPHEVAELLLALSATPVQLGGKPAVRLHIRHKNERGLPDFEAMLASVRFR